MGSEIKDLYEKEGEKLSYDQLLRRIKRLQPELQALFFNLDEKMVQMTNLKRISSLATLIVVESIIENSLT